MSAGDVSEYGGTYMFFGEIIIYITNIFSICFQSFCIICLCNLGMLFCKMFVIDTTVHRNFSQSF